MKTIVQNYNIFACFDYENTADEINGYKLGEVVYDQFGEFGIIIQIYGNDVRCDSNGICSVHSIKKNSNIAGCVSYIQSIKRLKNEVPVIIQQR